VKLGVEVQLQAEVELLTLTITEKLHVLNRKLDQIITKILAKSMIGFVVWMRLSRRSLGAHNNLLFYYALGFSKHFVVSV